MDKARKLAYEAHGGQMYGSGPYTVHLEEVVSLLSAYGSTAITLGYLHDVVEDTDIPIEKIEEMFGGKIAECVALLTDEPDINRSRRKMKTNAKLKSIAEISFFSVVLVVKTADRLANVRKCVKGYPKILKMYRKEHSAFRDAVYRPGLADEMWTELDSILA